MVSFRLATVVLSLVVFLASCGQTNPSTPTPEKTLDGTGLYAEYFSNHDFKGVRDSQINTQNYP